MEIIKEKRGSTIGGRERERKKERVVQNKKDKVYKGQNETDKCQVQTEENINKKNKKGNDGMSKHEKIQRRQKRRKKD